MKTSKVIKELLEMNMQIEKCGRVLYVSHCEDNIASINLDEKFNIDTDYVAFRNDLTEYEKERVYVLLKKLAETEPQDREEPQKFYLKFAALTDNGDETYLNYYETDDSLGMFTRYQEFGFQTEFTQKEIDEIKEKFGVTLSDFKQIPIEEVE